MGANIGDLEGRTWHYGLVAQWWLNKQAEPVMAGFTDIRFEARYTERPASVDDTDIVVIARRPAA